MTSVLLAQNQLITGVVLDNENSPIPGVNVVLKGTTTGTVTDVDGKYRIKADRGEVLVFSFVGFVNEEVEVVNQSVINVNLIPDIAALDEVVVVGYGTQKKVNLTGAVATVDLDDVEGRALTNSNQILQGKVAGVNIVQNSGRPGDNDATIRIRGISSIDNNNDPLVIIDGTVGNFSDVHPMDIKSISVLKDAASAAIYGSRASAGVIIIETKKGGDELRVNYNGTASLQSVTRLPDVVDSWQHAVLRNEARANVGSSEIYSDEEIELFKYQIDPRYPNVDWYDEYFDKALMQNHYISARGGDKNFNFTGSVGYNDQDGVLIGTSSEKLSYRTQLNANFLQKKVRVNLNMSGYNTVNKELISSTNTVMAEIANMKPSVFVRSTDPDTGEGNLYSYSGRFIGAMNQGGGIEREYNYLNTQASLEFEPIENLVGKVLIGSNKLKGDYVRLSPEFYTSNDVEENLIVKRDSELEKSWSQTDKNTLTTQLNYNINWGQHHLSALAAYERLERKFKLDRGYVKDLSSNQPVFGFGDPTSHYVESSANENATVSYFGRLNYSFADKYLLEMNIRKDGASRFAQGRKWGFFPSLSAGWRISEEKFFQSLNMMELKLRGSWGRLGNQNIYSFYAASDQMSGEEYYAFGNSIVSGRGTTVLANPQTTWETTEQLNIGLDATLWERFDMTVDYYYKTTYDILARVTIPPSLGVTTSPYQNIGDMLNEGVEFTLGYRNKYNPDGISYSINGNFSILKNEVTNLGVLDYVDHSPEIRSQVGESFASYYGYQLQGIYQVDDFTWQNNSDNSIPHKNRDYVLKEELADPSGIMAVPAPGDMKLKDLNGDGLITPDDKEIIGHSIPKINYGFSANIAYKNFALNIIGQGVSGADAYMTGSLIAPFWNSGQGTILQSTVENRWTYENPSDKYIRIYEDKARDAIASSYFIHNASYFRLKSVELSYQFPKDLLSTWDVSKLRVFASGENLLLITDFVEGFDPERNYNQTRANFHPQVTSYTMGVNLSF